MLLKSKVLRRLERTFISRGGHIDPSLATSPRAAQGDVGFGGVGHCGSGVLQEYCVHNAYIHKCWYQDYGGTKNANSHQIQSFFIIPAAKFMRIRRAVD